MSLRVIVAVTGASGAVYARLLVQSLLDSGSVARIGLVYSDNGRAVAEFEGQTIPECDARIESFDNADMFSSPASGSARWDAMVVVPCSMGAVGRMAHGISSDLISRAADVMLKERRPLIVVPREAPFSTLHLRNMAALSECGAVILPAAPSFYSGPATVEQLCMTVVERILAQLGLGGGYEWSGRRPAGC